MRVVAALFVIALLAGCAGAVPGNPQGYAGVNYATFTYPTEKGDVTGEVIGGKESQHVSITVKHPSGISVTYTAEDQKAFEGQRVRAAVEKAVSEDAKEAMPGIVDSITNAILKAAGG